jgi:hypothetical protein
MNSRHYQYDSVDGVMVVEDRVFFYAVGYLGRAREIAKKNGRTDVFEIPRTATSYEMARKRINAACEAAYFATFGGKLVSRKPFKNPASALVAGYQYTTEKGIADIGDKLVDFKLLTRDQADEMEVVS